ncbi:hypothetical protein [Prauserella halophila]
MDPRDRADAVLARAQRRTGVVTPDNMESPMDSADTQVIPSSVVRGAEQDPDATAKVPASVIERNDESHLSQPAPTVPLNQRDAAAAASGAAGFQGSGFEGSGFQGSGSPGAAVGPAAGPPAASPTPDSRDSVPRSAAPALAENARTQPLNTAAAQPVDTANAPPDMTFTGVPVTPGGPNPATQAGGPPNPTHPTREDSGAAAAGDDAPKGGFVPTTKADPGAGTSELARRLDGL